MNSYWPHGHRIILQARLNPCSSILLFVVLAQLLTCVQLCDPSSINKPVLKFSNDT